MVEIVQKENPVLRQIAKEVPIDKITSPKFQKIIRDMKEAMAAQDDGVAIAAPQIGEPYRIFIISKKIYEHAIDKPNSLTKDDSDLVCVNPELSSVSKTKSFMEEGCLSVRWLYGKVKRSTKATLKARNERGFEFTRRGSDLLAQVFQHEMDHLNGILFIDSAKEVRDLPPSSHADNEK